jgi:hypothetical protein
LRLSAVSIALDRHNQGAQAGEKNQYGSRHAVKLSDSGAAVKPEPSNNCFNETIDSAPV